MSDSSQPVELPEWVVVETGRLYLRIQQLELENQRLRQQIAQLQQAGRDPEGSAG